MEHCGYFRLSSEETSLDSRAFERHKQKLLDLGIKEEDIYYDLESGGNSNRENFVRVNEFLKNGVYNEISIANIERLTRLVIDWELFLISAKKNEFKINVLNRNYDLSTPEGKMMSRFDAIFAQQELEKNRERRLESWEHQRKIKSINSVPFGYVIENRKIRVDGTPYVCLLKNKKTLSCHDIAIIKIDKFLELGTSGKVAKYLNELFGGTRLNKNVGIKRSGKLKGGLTKDTRPFRKNLIFTEAGVKGWIKHPFLRGHLVYKKGKPDEQIIYDNHTPILKGVKDNRVNQILRTYKKTRGFTNKRAHSLTGLLICKGCGRSCVISRDVRSPNPINYCACRYKRVYSNYSHMKTRRYDEIEEVVIKELCKKYKEITEIVTTEEKPEESPEVRKLNHELTEMRELYLKFTNPRIKIIVQELELKIKRLKSNPDKDSHSKNELRELFLKQKVFGDSLFYYSLEPLRRGDYFRMFVEKVLLSTEEIEVILRL